MRRMIAVVVLTIVGMGGLLSRAQSPAGNVELVPDPKYQPSDGDRAEIVGENIPGADGRAILNMYVEARDRGDRAKMEQLEHIADVVKLSRRTAVQITRVYSPPRILPADPLRGFSLGEYQKAMREAVAREGGNPAGYPVEVRIIDGPNSGKTLVVEKEHIGRLVWRNPAGPNVAQDDLGIFDNPPKNRGKVALKPAPKPIQSKPVEPAAQAAAALQLGKNLRFDGKRDAAVEYFRKAIKVAPESPSARESAKILKELGVK